MATEPHVGAPPSTRRRSHGRIALAVLFALLALNAWAQVVLALFGGSDDPPTLIALQLLVGATAAVAAAGSWTGARWAPAGALLYALVTAGMIATLEPILDLGREARSGLWIGAASIIAFGLGAGWYLRREVRRSELPVDRE